MSPSERHGPMVVRVLSGTPAIFMAMAPPEQRECAPTSSEVNPNIVCTHSLGLVPNGGDDIQGADQAETLSGKIVADWGGRVASVFSQAEEDVDACSNWAG